MSRRYTLFRDPRLVQVCQQALAMTCDLCGAEAGQDCTTASNGRASNPHRIRIMAARESARAAAEAMNANGAEDQSCEALARQIMANDRWNQCKRKGGPR